MCGRFSLQTKPSQITYALRLPAGAADQIQPRYNIAPSQPVAGILRDPHLRLDFFTWGLVPSWSKDPAFGMRMINARAETLSEKPSFKGLLRSNRCLIPADGFYEWKNAGGRKQPYYIRLKSKAPFGFAGLWSHWCGPDGSEIRSCTIITTQPNELMASIHQRMPVILRDEAVEEWLDPSRFDRDRVLGLLRPLAAEEMEAVAVSTMVNSPANDRAECIRGVGAGE